MSALMDENQLKQRAADFLLANNVKAIVPKFSISDLTLAKKREVSFFTKLEDMVEDKMDGPGVSKYSLATLGHLGSKCSFTLQATWTGAPDERMDQKPISVTHPQPGELIHVVGKCTLGQSGINQLSFEIMTFQDNMKVTYATGTSSLTAYCTEESAESPIILTTATEAGLDNLTDPVSTSSANVISTSLSSLKGSSSPDTSLPQEVVQPDGTVPLEPTLPAQPEVIGIVPILRRPSDGQGPAPKRRRHVSFSIDDDPKIDYMLCNVETSTPRDKKLLMDKMRELGVDPINVCFEALPISSTNRFVFFFTVLTNTEKSAVENLVEKKEWIEQFSIQNLCRPNSKPFFYTSLPMSRIVQTIFLSEAVQRKVASESNLPMHLDLSEQLIDGRYIANAIKNKELVESVMCHLNKRDSHLPLDLCLIYSTIRSTAPGNISSVSVDINNNFSSFLLQERPAGGLFCFLSDSPFLLSFNLMFSSFVITSFSVYFFAFFYIHWIVFRSGRRCSYQADGKKDQCKNPGNPLPSSCISMPHDDDAEE
ncbi:hypothetical protein CAEBREN_05595 [Caenorhabditis brenneri]|uniref:Uncharacterized protein n=1 Tax=Caenorhabditis brenneri TaxID=135651 RepID=G0P851_CAEBE|nr:hypothetical protein CAEBREN_05595 [Caenorhabditis brenneri]